MQQLLMAFYGAESHRKETNPLPVLFLSFQVEAQVGASLSRTRFSRLPT